METKTETITQRPAPSLYGKIIGVVTYRSQLRYLCDSLTLLGVSEVEVFDAPGEMKQLEFWHETVSQYFSGDMEGRMLERYLTAVDNELIVFAAAVVPELADKVAEIARIHGASDVVHFGHFVVTNY